MTGNPGYNEVREVRIPVNPPRQRDAFRPEYLYNKAAARPIVGRCHVSLAEYDYILTNKLGHKVGFDLLDHTYYLNDYGLPRTTKTGRASVRRGVSLFRIWVWYRFRELITVSGGVPAAERNLSLMLDKHPSILSYNTFEVKYPSWLNELRPIAQNPNSKLTIQSGLWVSSTPVVSTQILSPSSLPVPA